MGKIPHQEVPAPGGSKLSGNFLHLQGATKAAPTAGGHPPMARPGQRLPSTTAVTTDQLISIVPRGILNLLYVLLGSFLELVKSPKPKLCSTSKKIQNIAYPWVLRCSEGLYLAVEFVGNTQMGGYQSHNMSHQNIISWYAEVGTYQSICSVPMDPCHLLRPGWPQVAIEKPKGEPRWTK